MMELHASIPAEVIHCSAYVNIRSTMHAWAPMVDTWQVLGNLLARATVLLLHAKAGR